MRAIALCLAVLVLFASSFSALGDEVKDAGKVNKILRYGSFKTPDLEPGMSGELAFNLTNPYSMNMTNVELNVSIYQYVEQEVSLQVDSSWGYEYPRFESASGSGREKRFTFGLLAVNASERISLVVLTSTSMPHGGIFTQGAYLVRFWLTFVFNGSTARMASPGYWSREQFIYATAEGDKCPPYFCVGEVNLTRLGGIDGILPDTAFGVKDMIPVWPFYALMAGVVFFIVLAFLYHADENPSQYPKTARAFAAFKGRLARVFRPRGRKEKPKT